MIDKSETRQNGRFRLETGLRQGKKFFRKIKKRELQQETKNLIHRSKKNIHQRSRQLQNFSYQEAFRGRKEGIKLSFNLAKRNVGRSKYRSTLLILGIILTVALETGIVVSVDTLYDDFLLDHRNQNFTDITVHPTSWHDMKALRTLTRTVKQVSGVSKSSPVFYTGVNQFVGETISGTNLLVFGIDASTHPDFPRINITAGKRVVNDKTIIISQRIQEQTGTQVDEIINLGELGDNFESTDVTIGGVMSDEPFFGNKIGFTFILVDIDTLYEIIPDNRKNEMLSSEIDIEVTNLLNIKRTSENIKDSVGISYFVFTEKDISEIEANAIQAYQTAMNLVILASFVVEFLFITNILAISIRDRSKEFGILRAVGTGSYQLIESVAAEILIYSIIGCTIGLVVGIGFSNLLIGIMDTFYTSLDFQGLSLHYSSLIATFLSGILIALISGLYPIFIAISIPVVQN
ncbi:MAG: ABC transporter permease, partial [Candidatus Heimdallarchaeota archaeon]|nr:ABC transporter permease [Candidatus Heimdallarchaeota archaeon]